MRVLHLCAAGFETGSGKAALLTHFSLTKMGVDSKILFLNGIPDESKGIFTLSSYSTYWKIKRLVVTKLEFLPVHMYPSRKKMLFSTGLVGLNLANLKLMLWADVIHIHWANHGMIELSEIVKWGKPIVWTLRDMWPLTGGCHHSFECNKYEKLCFKCPTLNSKNKFDISWLFFFRKKYYLKRSNIAWVAVSNWMRKVAESSKILTNKLIHVIPSGIDTGVFQSLNKTVARSELNLPLDAVIIAIGAASLNDEYKGFEYIKQALEKVNKEVLLISFGRFGSFDIQNEYVKIFHFGYVNSDTLLTKIYSASDMFFAPSVAESFGKTIAEAQSCGTPVLCFSNTGPSDIVEHLKTGYVAQKYNTSDLYLGLNFCLSNEFDRDYISLRTKELFDIKECSLSYYNLYNEILFKSRF